MKIKHIILSMLAVSAAFMTSSCENGDKDRGEGIGAAARASGSGGGATHHLRHTPSWAQAGRSRRWWHWRCTGCAASGGAAWSGRPELPQRLQAPRRPLPQPQPLIACFQLRLTRDGGRTGSVALHGAAQLSLRVEARAAGQRACKPCHQSQNTRHYITAGLQARTRRPAKP